MDLLKKIEGLKESLKKFENLVDELNDSIESKQKKINYLKIQIQNNAEKIDKIIKDFNANT